MIKAQELNSPDSCLNKSMEDEPVFVLCARDKVAPSVIRFWVSERIRTGRNSNADNQIADALGMADQMEDWAQDRCLKETTFVIQHGDASPEQIKKIINVLKNMFDAVPEHKQ